MCWQAFVFLGLSKTQYGALTLPFDLSVIGMTGASDDLVIELVESELVIPVELPV